MTTRTPWFSILSVAAAALSTVTTAVAEEAASDPARLARRPKVFYSVFNFGYGGDDFPEDPALFEKIVTKVGEEGKFNAIMCAWSDERAEICKKHGLKIMVDLLNGRHHIYRGQADQQTPAEAKALLEKLRGHDVVMGYHLWSDRFGGQGEGRVRDIQNCNAWDPTHPAYSATYKTHGMDSVAHADIFGWYDFHWKRSGWNRHYAALQTALPLAKKYDSIFYSLLSTDSGNPGRGNYNRSLWSLNQGVVYGMKGALWFIGMRQMDKATGEWTEVGNDINKVNAQIMPLKEELMKIGIPSAVYATPVVKDANNKDFATTPTMLPELAGNAFPADFWIQPAGGDFTMGVFKDDEGRDAVYVANFNAYVEQEVKLKLAKAAKASMFDRAKAAWVDLPAAAGVLTFKLGPGEGELLRFE